MNTALLLQICALLQLTVCYEAIPVDTFSLEFSSGSLKRWQHGWRWQSFIGMCQKLPVRTTERPWGEPRHHPALASPRPLPRITSPSELHLHEPKGAWGHIQQVGTHNKAREKCLSSLGPTPLQGSSKRQPGPPGLIPIETSQSWSIFGTLGHCCIGLWEGLWDAEGKHFVITYGMLGGKGQKWKIWQGGSSFAQVML